MVVETIVEPLSRRIFLRYVLRWDDCSRNMGSRTFPWLEHVNLTFSWNLGPQIGHSMIWMESSLFRPSLINPMTWKESLNLFILLLYTMFVGHPTNGITSMMLEQDEVGGERKREREREEQLWHSLKNLINSKMSYN